MIYTGFGITSGVHRLWCHRSYKARFPLRVFYAIGQTLNYQTSILEWSRGHRLHHKYADTDADPHNVQRGFCFAHFGWVAMKEHPLCDIKAKGLDMSDIEHDPVVYFQNKYYNQLFFLLSILLPTLFGVYVLDHSFVNSFIFLAAARNIWSIHITFFVNSWAHMFGERPYDDKIQTAECWWVSMGSFGEGYHNFHHKFPFDYATGELGNTFNLMKKFIDLMHYVGQAYDLKQASPQMIEGSRQKVIDNARRRKIYYSQSQLN